MTAILAHHAAGADAHELQASEDHSLTQGTAGWAALGVSDPDEQASS